MLNYLKSKIGKQVYRSPICFCDGYKDRYKKPIKIIDEGHAQFLHDCIEPTNLKIFWGDSLKELEQNVQDYFYSDLCLSDVMKTGDIQLIQRYINATRYARY